MHNMLRAAVRVSAFTTCCRVSLLIPARHSRPGLLLTCDGPAVGNSVTGVRAYPWPPSNNRKSARWKRAATGQVARCSSHCRLAEAETFRCMSMIARAKLSFDRWPWQSTWQGGIREMRRSPPTGALCASEHPSCTSSSHLIFCH